MGAFDFTRQTVVVTGASRGIGYAVAEGFAAAGADVAMIATTAQIHEAAARVAESAAGSVHGIVCDITDRNRVRDTVGAFDRIDVLVNNAGLELITPVEGEGDEVEETFRRIIEINVVGTFYVTRSAVPRMPKGSKIIITASIWSKTAVAGFSAYCASKHANLGFARSIAQELGPRGINVNAVCPGFIRTDASMRSVRSEARRTGTTEEDVTQILLRNQALPGLLEPRDVVPTYLFLASDHARDISGQSLHVDRGDVMD